MSICDDSQGDATGKETGHKRKVSLTSAHGVTPARVRWWWQGRMALGALSLVAGPEGLGKSTLVYQLAADTTCGTLPGEYKGAPKSVLIAATEDSWAHTIVPRLMAAGADLTRIYRVDVTTTLGVEGALSLPADLPALGEAAKQVDAGQLVLDPLTSRLHAALDTHKDSETRRALEPLVRFADEHNLAVVGIMHFNKSGSTDPLSLVMASKAFTAVARSVSSVIKDPDDDTEAARLFGTVKNNLGRADLPTLRFTIGGYRIDAQDDGDIWTGKLVWGSDATGTISDALVRGADTDGNKSAAAEAAEWLKHYLGDNKGCAPSQAVKDAAKADHHGGNSLRAARKRLGIQTVNVSEVPRWTIWALKDHECVQSCYSPRGEDTTNITNTTGGKVSSRVSRVSRVGTGEQQTRLDSQPPSEPVERPLEAENASTPDVPPGHVGRAATGGRSTRLHADQTSLDGKPPARVEPSATSATPLRECAPPALDFADPDEPAATPHGDPHGWGGAQAARELADQIYDGSAPSATACQDCGNPISRDRAAYGKPNCASCGQVTA